MNTASQFHDHYFNANKPPFTCKTIPQNDFSFTDSCIHLPNKFIVYAFPFSVCLWICMQFTCQPVFNFGELFSAFYCDTHVTALLLIFLVANCYSNTQNVWLGYFACVTILHAARLNNFTCCHIVIEVPDQSETCFFTPLWYCDTGPTSSSTQQSPGRIATKCQFACHLYDRKWRQWSCSV